MQPVLWKIENLDGYSSKSLDRIVWLKHTKGCTDEAKFLVETLWPNMAEELAPGLSLCREDLEAVLLLYVSIKTSVPESLREFAASRQPLIEAAPLDLATLARKKYNERDTDVVRCTKTKYVQDSRVQRRTDPPGLADEDNAFPRRGVDP